jgi:hypothetical protein
MRAIDAGPRWSEESAASTRPAASPEVDPFTVPVVRTAIAELRPRSRAAVAGRVTAVVPARWAGGPTLEVTLDDGTGTLLLAFVGRRRLAGVDPGRRLVATGTVVLKFGRPMLMNPYFWLEATVSPGPG